MSAAVLSCPRAVVAGTSAAYLHGLEGFGVSRPVIMVPWSGNARSPIARVIRSVFFQTVATDRRKGFLATTAAETVVTLATDLPKHRLEAVLDDSLLTGRASIGEYEDILDRLEGSHVAGLGNLRPLIAERSPTASEVDSSYLERLLERVLADPRVPSSAREHPFQLNGFSARVDAYVPEWGIVVEADGRRWHARQAEFESDRRRDNELAALGVQVLRFTYSMLRNEPECCLANLLEVGAHRRATRRAERDRTHDE
jgi:very-short-patch-repair endonuclease